MYHASGGQKPFCKKVSGLPKIFYKGSLRDYDSSLRALRALRGSSIIIEKQQKHLTFTGFTDKNKG